MLRRLLQKTSTLFPTKKTSPFLVNNLSLFDSVQVLTKGTSIPLMNKKRRPSRARKYGEKQRKQKFLSLRLQFTADEIKSSAETATIRQESEAEEREVHDPENVALFFTEGDGGDTTLNGLLNASAAESISSHANSNSSRVGDLSPASASASLSYSYREERAALVRTAMRNRERDSSGEKWVRYSEVVERKVKEEEVSSSSVDVQRRHPPEAEKGTHGGGPLLKLDYDEILNAWSNKGPLYIDGESSQIVPDINHDVVSHEASNISQLHDYNYQGLRFGCSVGFWTVPEVRRTNLEEEWKVSQREASMLRYKVKRQNRLFSKKVRYQVRKLNAEKRPRLKGRFVKKSSE